MSPGDADLDRATSIEGEGGRYVSHLSKDWEIWGPNGGYLATFALRAAGAIAQIPQPASFYCHFLNSPAFDAIELSVTALKQGRRAESFAVEMTQDGKPILHALVKTAADAPGHHHQHATAPDVPRPAELKPYEDLFPPSKRPPFAFWDRVERRPVDQSTSNERSDPIVREWTRYRPRACFEDPFVDAARSLILLDTYGFPAAWRHYRSMEYLAPSLDISAWFHRSSPDCKWLLIDHECSLADRGLMAASGRVWDTDGRLLATGAAQLCCIPGR